ncbi:MAG TPA: peptidylprolyl isomerase [Anaeromyxobacteraceae bacterium]|nr:peptidylprolyl isomerase [Anaeromyxobacteraceae bacterium]
MRNPAVLWVAVVSVASLAACRGGQAASPRPAPEGPRVLATVNGVPITEGDVGQRVRVGVSGQVAGHAASSPNVLQTIVREELIFQRSLQLGLDQDEAYRRKLDDLEAQLRTFRRQEMAARFRRHVQERAAVTDAEAREYYEKNATTIGTRFHVLQIFYKGKLAEITRDRQEIAGGAPFEEVASRRFTGLPASGKAPWDLGELRWSQLPPAWRGVVDRMEPGQVSEILKGEGDRLWVIKLVGRTLDPAVSFEGERERIAELLRQQKAADLYASALAEMTGKALVVYAK